MSKIIIERETLQMVFDTAVNSLDFGSGFLDDEDVAGLRAAAVLLGVDPDVATPLNFKCKYNGKHKPWGNDSPSQAKKCRFCHIICSPEEGST